MGQNVIVGELNAKAEDVILASAVNKFWVRRRDENCKDLIHLSAGGG